MSFSIPMTVIIVSNNESLLKYFLISSSDKMCGVKSIDHNVNVVGELKVS